ncbi:MAG: hypothetical protein ACQETL_15735 [Bacteroidota bacterium]
MKIKKYQFDISDPNKFRTDLRKYIKYRKMNLRPGKADFFWGELKENDEFELIPGYDFFQRVLIIKFRGIIKNERLIVSTSLNVAGIIYAIIFSVFIIGIEIATNFILIPSLLLLTSFTLSYRQLKKDHKNTIIFIENLINNGWQK